MKWTNVILIVTSIIIVASIIIFHIKFTDKFSFDNFMHTLENKIYNIQSTNETNKYPSELLDAFEEVFGRYTDSSGLLIAFYILMSLFILIITIVEIIILLKFQFCKCGCRCNINCCSLFFPTHSLLNMIIYIVLAFGEKHKVNLEEKNIYVFDDDFNKEIRKNIDFMKTRKIYIIVCSFVAFIGIAVQLAMVIINYIKEKKRRKGMNNNNHLNSFNAQPQMVYSEDTSQQNHNVNDNGNNYNYNKVVPVN